ncbi:MAG TPA: DUF6438 domain-containing protein [Candidatus Binatia bacterium]|nr:DUF6438 domain-containing protein [Candidatus Binatia bacterium]
MASLRYVALAALVVALAFLGVSSSPAQTVDLGSLSDNDLKAVVIHLERTRCYGNCPAYVLTIHGDGSVEYLDKEKPGIKDPQKGKIDGGALKALVAEFARMKFLSLPDYLLEKCTCRQCTDLPSAITEIVVRGETHRVRHDYGCGCAPKELFELEKAIDKAVKVEQWAGDTSKKGPFGTTCFDPRPAPK